MNTEILRKFLEVTIERLNKDNDNNRLDAYEIGKLNAYEHVLDMLKMKSSTKK